MPLQVLQSFMLPFFFHIGSIIAFLPVFWYSSLLPSFLKDGGEPLDSGFTAYIIRLLY